LLSPKLVLQKKKKNMKAVGKLDSVQTRFCSFLVDNSPKEDTVLARQGPKFP
jgi:hypothetical protein